jgi:hypothetical protein
MNSVIKQAACFLYSELSVKGPTTFGNLTETNLNVWRAEYCRTTDNLIDDLTYVEDDKDLLAARLAAVFDADNGGPSAARMKLAALASLGKLFADLIARKADEAGDHYVGEAYVDGYFAECPHERLADMAKGR